MIPKNKTILFRKYFSILLLNLIILLFVGPVGAGSSSDKEVNIYYTGNTYGYLKPCPT